MLHTHCPGSDSPNRKEKQANHRWLQSTLSREWRILMSIILMSIVLMSIDTANIDPGQIAVWMRDSPNANHRWRLSIFFFWGGRRILVSMLPILTLTRMPLIRPGTGNDWSWIRVVIIHSWMTVNYRTVISLGWNGRELASVVLLVWQRQLGIV